MSEWSTFKRKKKNIKMKREENTLANVYWSSLSPHACVDINEEHACRAIKNSLIKKMGGIRLSAHLYSQYCNNVDLCEPIVSICTFPYTNLPTWLPSFNYIISNSEDFCFS